MEHHRHRREDLEERLEERREAFQERQDERFERRGERLERPHGHHHEHESSRSAVSSAAAEQDISRQDFVSDEEFERRFGRGRGEAPRQAYTEPPARRYNEEYPPPPTEPSYNQQGYYAGEGGSRVGGYPDPGVQRSSTYAPVYSSERQDYQPPAQQGYYSRGESLRGEEYAQPARYANTTSSGYAPPGGPPPSFAAPTTSHGAASEYYNSAPTHAAARAGAYRAGDHEYSHIARMASVHDADTDPALYEEVAQRLHNNGGQQAHHQAPVDHDAYLAAHAQAYGEDSRLSDDPMSGDDIASAAAVQAFKLSAQHQPHTSSQPPAIHDYGTAAPAPSHAQPSTPRYAAPSYSPRPQLAGNSGEDRLQHPSPTPDAHASAPTPSPGGGGSPQDKIVALAMAQAAKLFDKQSGGSPAQGSAASAAKMQAMQSAASIVMRLAGDYKTSGKLNLQPGEMQKLIGAAMSLF